MDELAALIQKTKAGDMEAYGEVVRRFQDMAYGYAYSMLGDFHLAEDAAQEAFIHAYQRLGDLADAAAFPGWFRRIAFTTCGQFLRRKEFTTVPLEQAEVISDRRPLPTAEDREMQENVMHAIRALPEHQREVTTLFYINGYSQGEIAAFLDVPVGTVKKRLHDARNHLKERMMSMVEETLKDHAPDERFSKQVIESLLDRPKLLNIKGHPVQGVLESVLRALPDYEYVESEELVAKKNWLSAGGDLKDVYHADAQHVLRMSVATTMNLLLPGRTPPVRIITAGRVFKPVNAEKGFPYHQAEICCIDSAADEGAMRSTILKVIEAAIGSRELVWKPTEEKRFNKPFVRIYVKMEQGERERSIIACGMMSDEELRRYGYDPEKIKGFRFGMGLETLAAIKYAIDDTRKLWQPPYVPKE